LWLLEGRAILYKTTVFDREKFLESYDRYHRFVCDYFKDRPNDILLLDLKESNKWEILCRFLDKSIPNIEYPHLNKRLE
jgi:hypothetical protein